MMASGRVLREFSLLTIVFADPPVYTAFEPPAIVHCFSLSASPSSPRMSLSAAIGSQSLPFVPLPVPITLPGVAVRSNVRLQHGRAVWELEPTDGGGASANVGAPASQHTQRLPSASKVLEDVRAGRLAVAPTRANTHSRDISTYICNTQRALGFPIGVNGGFTW